MKKGKTIPIEVEEQIREALRQGINVTTLAIAYGVSKRTVARIKQMLDTIEGESSRLWGVNTTLYKAVVREARKGFTQYSTSHHYCISDELVGVICRHAYARRRTSENRASCPTCGNIMTKVAEEPVVKDRGIKITPLNFVNVSCVINEDAMSILADLEALDNLGIIGNKLFCDLAMRATKLLNEIEKACDI